MNGEVEEVKQVKELEGLEPRPVELGWDGRRWDDGTRKGCVS